MHLNWVSLHRGAAWHSDGRRGFSCVQTYATCDTLCLCKRRQVCPDHQPPTWFIKSHVMFAKTHHKHCLMVKATAEHLMAATGPVLGRRQLLANLAAMTAAAHQVPFIVQSYASGIPQPQQLEGNPTDCADPVMCSLEPACNQGQSQISLRRLSIPLQTLTIHLQAHSELPDSLG